jgi:hypothetical protein
MISNMAATSPRTALSLFERDDLASVVAQGNHPSLGLSLNASSLHSDGNTQCTSREPEADGVPGPSNDSEHNYSESLSELEKDMLHAFREQEDLSPANMPSPSHSHFPSSEPAWL